MSQNALFAFAICSNLEGLHHLQVFVCVTAIIHVGDSKWFKAGTDATHIDAIGGRGAVKSCCVVPFHSGKHPALT